MRTVSLALLSFFFLTTCAPTANDQEGLPAQPMTEPPACPGLPREGRFPAGSAEGHKDVRSARAAGQARAGRITDAGLIRQPEDARGLVKVGDYLLINDKIALYIEGARTSDGYSSLGGEILAIEPVGEDGLPVGVSRYNETLIGLSRQSVAAESVTVLNDGSDGKAAIVRVSGPLSNIPFLDSFSLILRDEYGFPAALDYVLEPGAEKVTLRLSLRNPDPARVDFAGAHFFGFFQSARSRVFTESQGFDTPSGRTPFVAFDGGAFSFLWRVPGSTMRAVLGVSGFLFFMPDGFAIEGCSEKTVDLAEIIAGGPGLDGLLMALRRTDGVKDVREVTGKVTDMNGTGVAGVRVHALGRDGRYLSYADTDEAGAFALHLLPGAASLVPVKRGHDAAPVELAERATTASLTLRPNGTLRVRVRDEDSGEPIPARVQVVPAQPPQVYPTSMGVEQERHGRLHQEFALSGEAVLVVPPGQHRVIVSRGYEWELLDKTVDVGAGAETLVEARLAHSVDSTSVMCADFHIHSNFSADSSDPPEDKVKSAIADGLEIPVSSEHEWIIDFQPIIRRLGLTRHAFGLPSEEFTTFTWGHFGIIPISPRRQAINSGAITWIGRKPEDVFREIHELPERPVLIVNHPSGGGVGAYFDVAGLRRDTGRGDPELWSDRFEAVEVFNDSDFEQNRTESVADWLALLDSGKIVWAVGSSDSHSIRTTPVGYPRTCLRLGHDDPERLSAEAVRDALARGAATVSGGLYMTVEGPGGAGPGAMLPPQPGPRTFRVVVQAPSWLSASTLEVIVDGETERTIELVEAAGPGRARRYESEVAVSPRRERAFHYVIFHASARGKDLAPLHPGRRPFAVSNPIFF